MKKADITAEKPMCKSGQLPKDPVCKSGHLSKLGAWTSVTVPNVRDNKKQITIPVLGTIVSLAIFAGILYITTGSIDVMKIGKSIVGTCTAYIVRILY